MVDEEGVSERAEVESADQRIESVRVNGCPENRKTTVILGDLKKGVRVDDKVFTINGKGKKDR